jgi:hypothetical protein
MEEDTVTLHPISFHGERLDYKLLILLRHLLIFASE